MNWTPISGMAWSSLALALACVAACSPSGTPASPEARPAVAPRHAASADGLATVVGPAPAGAVVSLEPEGGPPPPPATPVAMDQRGKQFLPGFLMTQAGQGVTFLNNEDIPHNIFVVQRRVGRTVLDVSTDPGQQHTHVFERAGEFDVSCNIHPGMEAAIVVTASPYAAVADATAHFTVLNVPPGTYTLVISNEGSPTETTLTVTAPLTDVGAPGR